MILGGHGCLMGVNGVTTPSSEVASRFDLRKRAGEAKVRERGGGRGGGIGVPQSRPRAGAHGRNVPFGMDTLRGPAQYKQMCLLEISTSWAGSRAGKATGPGIRPGTEVHLFRAFFGNAYFNFCYWTKGQLRVERIKSLLSNCQ